VIAVGVVGAIAVVGIIAITLLGESASERFEPVPVGNIDAGDDTYGDDAHLDSLWDACAGGSGAACDDLFFESPIGSQYEDFGNTCGNRFSQSDAPFSCEDAIG
jgi:hypothetical protein